VLLPPVLLVVPPVLLVEPPLVVAPPVLAGVAVSFAEQAADDMSAKSGVIKDEAFTTTS